MADKKQEPKPKPTLKELLERINKAAQALDGQELSSAREESILSHLGSVASNMEGEIRDARIARSVT